MQYKLSDIHHVKRSDLLDEISVSVDGVSKAKSEEMLDTILLLIGQRVAEGCAVSLPGFGTFYPKKIEALSGTRHFKGKDISYDCPVRYKIAFKPSNLLNRTVENCKELQLSHEFDKQDD